MRAGHQRIGTRRFVSSALLLALLVVLVPQPLPAIAANDATAEQEFTRLVNAERTARGVPSLAVCTEIRSVSRRHAQRMASEVRLHHNPNLGAEVPSWARVAENVGRGPSVSSIHAALMASDGHRRNILDADVTQVGIGVEVDAAGRVWVTQVFRRPAAGATCSSTTVSEPTPRTEPVHLAGDFNGDGEDDLAIFDPSTGEWTVKRRTPSGEVSEVWGRFRTRSGWESHLVGDFDGDGRDDVASFHPGSGNWVVSRSSGSGFSSGVWTQFRTRSGWESHLVGDFDGDGRDDVASFHPGSGNWVVSRSASELFSVALL